MTILLFFFPIRCSLINADDPFLFQSPKVIYWHEPIPINVRCKQTNYFGIDSTCSQNMQKCYEIHPKYYAKKYHFKTQHLMINYYKN